MKFTGLRPFFKDIILTFATEMAVLVSFFLLYRLIAQNYGPQGVGEYSLIKRAVGVLQPLFLLGLGIGLPRYLATSESPQHKHSFMKTGATTSLLLTISVLAAANIFKDGFSELFFGSTRYSGLVFPFSIFSTGLIVHALVYSYYRGTLAAKKFNSLQLVNLSFVPLAVFMSAGKVSMEAAVFLIGCITLAIAVLFSIPFIKEMFLGVRQKIKTGCFRELFSYSLPRCAGDFLYGAFLSLGPIIVVHMSTTADAGYLSLSQSLLVALGALISPLGLILLPKVSSMLASGQQETVARNVNLFVGAVIQVGMFLSFQAFIFADFVINFWLGPGFSAAIPVARTLFASIMFFSFYSATVSILNGSRKKPLDMINVSMALAVFIALAFFSPRLMPFFPPVMGMAVIFSGSTMFLGLLAYRALRSIYPQIISKDLGYLTTALLVNLFGVGLSVALRHFIPASFVFMVFFEMILGISYLFGLWFLKVDWLRELVAKIN